MKIISLRQRIRIRILIFLVIIFAIISLVVYPSVKDILRLENDINDIELFLEEQYQRVQRMQRNNIDIESIASSTTRYTDFTLPPGSELLLIKQFEDFAADHDIDQQFNVSYSTAKDPDTGLPYYQFSFLNHGPYDEQLAYLDELLSLPYIVSIDSVEISRRNNTSGQANAPKYETTLKFNARIYVK